MVYGLVLLRPHAKLASVQEAWTGMLVYSNTKVIHEGLRTSLTTKKSFLIMTDIAMPDHTIGIRNDGIGIVGKKVRQACERVVSRSKGTETLRIDGVTSYKVSNKVEIRLLVIFTAFTLFAENNNISIIFLSL